MKQVAGFPDYFISEDGLIVNKKGKVIKKRLSYNGYNLVTLDYKTRRVGRLVLLTYKPTDDLSLQCNHIDGNKLNDSLSNLEWTTASENCLHKFRVLGHKGTGGVKPRSIRKTNLMTGETRVYKSLMEAERDGYARSAIRRCIQGVVRKHKDCTFEYID